MWISSNLIKYIELHIHCNSTYNLKVPIGHLFIVAGFIWWLYFHNQFTLKKKEIKLDQIMWTGYLITCLCNNCDFHLVVESWVTMFVSVGYLIIAAYQWYRNRVRHSMVHRYISSSLRLGSVIVQRVSPLTQGKSKKSVMIIITVLQPIIIYPS